jgi:hypothetical protein
MALIILGVAFFGFLILGIPVAYVPAFSHGLTRERVRRKGKLWQSN